MDYEDFYSRLADIVDMGMTHAFSFEMRRLKSEERANLSAHLREVAKQHKKTK